MLRDYNKGINESFDIHLDSVGAGTIPLQLDGMINFAFSELQIFSDSGYIVPLNPSAFEAVDEDEVITIIESDTIGGGTGETVYSSYRIIDPTYQNTDIYIRVNSFGAYVNGALVGQDYIEMLDQDSAFTIEKGVLNTIIDCSAITTSRTLTLDYEDGCNYRNQLKIINNSDYKLVVTDSIINVKVQEKQYASFYASGGNLINHKQKYDSGFFAPIDYTGAIETITHDLNEDVANLILEGWVKNDTVGSEQNSLFTQVQSGGAYGVSVLNTASKTSFDIVFGQNGLLYLNSVGSQVNINTGTNPKIRIIAYKKED